MTASLTRSSFTLDPQLQQDSFHVTALALCDLRLMNDAHYPWLILVPMIDGKRDIVDLSAEQRYQLSDDISLASNVLRALYSPYKLNVAALGNMVEQLHVHVIARFQHDTAWPKPVWGQSPARAYTDQQREQIIRDITSCLARHR